MGDPLKADLADQRYRRAKRGAANRRLLASLEWWWSDATAPKPKPPEYRAETECPACGHSYTLRHPRRESVHVKCQQSGCAALWWVSPK